jgi:apolipoprotein D and lipocalin family protein
MKRAVLAVLGALAIAGAARAEAPEPRRPLDLERFMGRWYEILRTPNGNERNCYAVYQDWSAQERAGKSEQRFQISQHCHRGSPTGSDRVVNTSARVLNPPANTKFEASFFGGLIRGRYWVVDHADDYSWMIATTEDGRYPALLARTPGLPTPQQDRLKARMAQIGFDTGKLQAVGEP